MNMLRKKLNNKGFTIIELIVVIAVLAILVLLAVSRFTGYTERARVTRIQNDVKAVENKVHEYLIKYNHFNKDTFVLSDIEEDEVVYSKEGKIDKEDLSDKGPFYKANDLSLVKDANSKLDGTFIANDKGEAFYVGKNIDGDSVVSDGEAGETDQLVAEGYIPVATAEELAHIRLNSSEARIFGAGTKWEEEFIGKLDSKYIQVKDIDLSGYDNWEPIGNPSSIFNGTYNGGIFKITGLTINRPNEDYIGLFGAISESTIENIALEGVNVVGATYGGGQVGGLVGGAESSTISNSYATGSVTGYSQTGGLVGMSNETEINGSHSSAIVDGTIFGTFVGGLVGNTWKGSVENSYATGSVIGMEEVGGLVGGAESSTKIENSYATGKVNGNSYVGGLVGRAWESTTTTSSYYDTQATGRSTSAKGEGKTTAEMQTQSTYIGWDFTDIWQITEGNYPTLR